MDALKAIKEEIEKITVELKDSKKPVNQEQIKSVTASLERLNLDLQKALKGKTSPELKVHMEKGTDKNISEAIKVLKTEKVIQNRIDSLNLGNVILGLWHAVDQVETDLLKLKKKVQIERGGTVDFERYR